VEIFCGTKNFGSFANNLPEEALMMHQWKRCCEFPPLEILPP
jgi:hypothetical protein